LVERELQKELERGKKLKRKHLKVKFFYISVGRDEIFPALMAGKGDIAAANLTITPSRQAMVDFAVPNLTDVEEVVVTDPGSPAVSTLDDLLDDLRRHRLDAGQISAHESLISLCPRTF